MQKFIFICLKQIKNPNYVELLHHLSFKNKIEKYALVKKFQVRKFEKRLSQWEFFFLFIIVQLNYKEWSLLLILLLHFFLKFI